MPLSLTRALKQSNIPFLHIIRCVSLPPSSSRLILLRTQRVWLKMRKCRDWQFPTVLTRFESLAWQGTRGACSTMPDTSCTSTLLPTCARNHLVANRPLWDSTSVRLPRGKRRLPESSCSTSPTSVVRPNSIGRAPLDRSYLRKDDPRDPSTPPMVMPETPGAVRSDDVTCSFCKLKNPLTALSLDWCLFYFVVQP